jgi:hypothetical protein
MRQPAANRKGLEMAKWTRYGDPIEYNGHIYETPPSVERKVLGGTMTVAQAREELRWWGWEF